MYIKRSIVIITQIIAPKAVLLTSSSGLTFAKPAQIIAQPAIGDIVRPNAPLIAARLQD